MILRIAEERKKRYDELHDLLADQNIVSNKAQYQAYAREMSGLAPLINEYNSYQRTLKDLEDMKNVLKEKHDKDFTLMVEEEHHKLEEFLKASKLKLEEFVLEKESGGDKDIIVEIRAGTGGLEASLFVADLLRMYSKYAIKKGWKAEPIDSSTTEKGGYKEVVFSISGKSVYDRLRFESGTHRVQRVPDTEASGRIHTSAVTVVVLPEAEEVDVEVKPEDIKIDVFRAGGAGGQGVNKTDSAVRMTHIPTGMVVTCQDERSQLKNKAKALKVLRARLFDMRKTEHDRKISQARKSQVGSGDRSEKIRTYNFPDRRVTDHRIGFTVHNLVGVLEGDLDAIIDALKAEDRKLRLAAK